LRARQLSAVVLTGALALVAGSAAASAGAPSARAATTAAASAENAFALNLLRLVGGSGNVVYSPYSVDAALTMAGAGAEGPTAAQIDRVLGAPSAAAADANAAALASASGAPTVELANALWIERGIPLQTPFVTTLTDTFGAAPQDTNFSGAPQAARQAINAWVSAHTAKLIEDLLPDGSVTAATVFVLANAIYLKAHWATPFDTRLTHAAPFTTSTDQQVSVPFMSAQLAPYPYASASGYQAVDLPYRSSSLSLLALLPTGESPTRFEPTLNAGTLASLLAALRLRRVNLLMPKLHLHTQTSLNAPLESLGMKDAFGPAANFGAITTKVPLQISLVEHAADLKIDEQGTVAAAATGIVGPTAIALPTGPPVTVDLDRPYLLLLRDDTSGAILFVARVADPGNS